eukprot:jgi/Botrbrau1/17223/Bobra.0621s0001.1
MANAPAVAVRRTSAPARLPDILPIYHTLTVKGLYDYKGEQRLKPPSKRHLTGRFHTGYRRAHAPAQLGIRQPHSSSEQYQQQVVTEGYH